MNSPEQTAIALREKLGCPIVQISEETRAIADGLHTLLFVFPSSNSCILVAIEQSGLWAEPERWFLAEEVENWLNTERKQQAILKVAGIVDDATAIAWMDSVRGDIERDRAEYEAILERHRVEIAAFLESKRGGQ